MAKSTITSKGQTTVPREIREKLGLSTSDILNWEALEGWARVTTAGRRFMQRRGAIRAGSGSVVADLRKLRRTRGKSCGE